MDDNNDTQAVESPHKRVKSYYGETSVKTEESVYTWTIKNFSNFYMKNPRVESPVFTTEFNETDIEWYLAFYPNGEAKTREGYTSLTLYPMEALAETVTVYIKFSTLIYKEVGCFQEEIQHEDFITFLDNATDCYNVDEFLEKKNLCRFLHNGNLTIRCRVYAYLSADESDASEIPLSRMKKQTTVDLRIGELEDFGKLFENEKFSDVALAVGEEKFLAHKNLLSARSRVFAAMFEHNMKENQENLVTIVDVESEVMREVLRFIYSAQVNNLEPLAQKLLAAADKYELNGLKLMCEEVLIEKLSDKTIGDILLLVDRHDTEKLRTATLEFITIHANELASQDSLNEAIKFISPLLVSTVIKTLMLKI